MKYQTIGKLVSILSLIRRERIYYYINSLKNRKGSIFAQEERVYLTESNNG